MLRPTTTVFAATALWALTLMPPPARAAEACTPITMLPAVISTPGRYCLTKNVGTTLASGAAIEITADHVTLDCGGRVVNGLGGGSGTQATGILAAGDFVTVRGCTVRGFHTGIASTYPADPAPQAFGGVIIEHNRVHESRSTGILADATGTVVRGNLVADTGGVPNVDIAAAIVANGNAEIVDNVIDGVYPRGEGELDEVTGIFAQRGGNLVLRNRVRNLAAAQRTALWIGGHLEYAHAASIALDNLLDGDVACIGERSVLRGNTVFGQPLPGCLTADPVAMPIVTAAAVPATTACTAVTSLPVVISTKGVYCLASDLTTSITAGTAISIVVDDVTLDCRDHWIDGLGGGAATTATGIVAVQRSRVTVRGCGLAGFRTGIRLVEAAGAAAPPTGVIVENNRVTRSMQNGIVVDADAGIVRGNVVAFAGSEASTRATGIHVRYSTDVVDNGVVGVFGNGAYGINAISNVGGTIAGNRVLGPQDTPGAAGIRVANAQRTLVSGNTLIATPWSADAVAVSCSGQTARLRGNTAMDYPTAFIGTCSDDGGNFGFAVPLE